MNGTQKGKKGKKGGRRERRERRDAEVSSVWVHLSSVQPYKF